LILPLLRHLSLCFWISLVVAGLGSLWILPFLQPFLGLDAAPLIFAGVLTAVFAAVVWAANRLGSERVRRLIQEADRDEREGRRVEAQRAYQLALRTLDGFLLSPGVRRRVLMPLVARMARSYLSESPFRADAEDFVVRYLWSNPQDEEVAEEWLRQVGSQGGMRAEHEDLADRLASAHPRHAIIQREVARLFLALERSDYPALQTYRRVCAANGRVPPEFCQDLARLFRKDGRSDEWSQQVFRQAGDAAPAADERPAAEDAQPSRRPAHGEVRVARDLPALTDEENAVFRMSAGEDEAEEEEDERTCLVARTWHGPGRWERLIRRSADALDAGLERLRSLSAGWTRLRTGFWHPPARRGGLVVLLIAGIVGGGWMALNLAGFFETPSPEPPTAARSPAAAPPPADQIADQVALQVAAYLKQDYALKLVEDLKQKGLNAYWVETASSGKTWYQVRIAPFRDQPTAREFGRNLKSKGVIDDFYVTSAGR
jgi:hypothetical protein